MEKIKQIIGATEVLRGGVRVNNDKREDYSGLQNF
jgi:hypothetical protein